MRRLAICSVLALFVLPAVHQAPRAAPAGAEGARQFLDLPDGFGTDIDDVRDDRIITLYDESIEGDGFIFCLDRSGSMAALNDAGEVKFAVLKREIVRAIHAMGADCVAGVHFYDGSMEQLTYGNPPLRMDDAGKVRLIGQVIGTQLSKGSCLCRGAEKALAIANATRKDHRTIVIVGDGRTQCGNGEQDPERVRARILTLNKLRLPINTVYTGPRHGEDWELGMPLLRDLALATGGQFRIAR